MLTPLAAARLARAYARCGVTEALDYYETCQPGTDDHEGAGESLLRAEQHLDHLEALSLTEAPTVTTRPEEDHR